MFKLFVTLSICYHYKAPEMTLAELTAGEFSLVYSVLSLAIAAMIGSAFFVARRFFPKYRPAMIMSSLVVGIAATLLAYIQQLGSCIPPLGREHTWLRASRQRRVPLRRLAFDRSTSGRTVAVLALPKAKRASMMWRLIIASALMIGQSYRRLEMDTVTRDLGTCQPFHSATFCTYFGLNCLSICLPARK